jgi:hypothetical protein
MKASPEPLPLLLNYSLQQCVTGNITQYFVSGFCCFRLKTYIASISERMAQLKLAAGPRLDLLLCPRV